MDPFQTKDQDPILDYNNMLTRYTLRTPDPPVACGRRYVRLEKLKEWYDSRTTSPRGEQTTQATRLLRYAYRNWRNHIQSIITKDKLFGSNPCIIVFSILLKIGWGDLIHLFRALQRFDKDLPNNTPDSLKETFRDIASMTDDTPRPIYNPDEIAEQFYKEQWQFCPAKFGFGDFHVLKPHLIIPIHKKELINNKGGTATLWQIEVLKEFVTQKLQETVPTSEYTPVVDPEHLGARYHFALKVFNEGKTVMFHNEKDAFNALRGHTGMVRYLGAYTHEKGRKSEGEDPAAFHTETKIASVHNILLEYGDRDLDELFIYSLPPVQQKEIEVFWEHLFEVSDAVKRIHNLEIKDDGTSVMLDGWHADIKPDNILEIEGKFKLADPGFAKFLEKDKGKSNCDPKAKMDGGTYSYGAPELHPGYRGVGKVNQTIDVWSLGCVFSVAATWVALGIQGVKQYSELRAEAIKTKIKNRDANLSSHSHEPQLDYADHFHDGIDVLQEVVDWHKYLRSLLRKTDRITSLVLDLVDEHMLVGSPDLRIKSSDLCEKLATIWEKLEESTTSVPGPILDFLRALNTSISASTANTASIEIVTPNPPSHIAFKDRQDLKSKFLKAPLIPTTHRSYHTSMAAPPQTSGKVQRLPFLQVEGKPPESSTADIYEAPQAIIEAASQSSISYPSQTPLPLRNNLKSSPSFSSSSSYRESYRDIPNEDVYAVKTTLSNRKKGLRSIFSKSTKNPDEVLTRYYIDRDIMFLVDNAISMLEHWENVKLLLRVLLQKVEHLDKNGVDLAFTQSSAGVKNTKQIAKIMEKMSLLETQPKRGVSTDMVRPLQNILGDYKSSVMKRRFNEQPKNLTIIVLTDGIWENTTDKDDVGRAIVSFVQDMQKMTGRNFVDRSVSIEFIQFGNDPEATYMLEKLDNGLADKEKGIPDLVDTEHWQKNVYKMLLGSLVPIFDESNDHDSLSPTGPLSPTANRSSYTSARQRNDSMQVR